MTTPYGDPKDYRRSGDNGPYALGGFQGKGGKKKTTILGKIIKAITKR